MPGLRLRRPRRGGAIRSTVDGSGSDTSLTSFVGRERDISELARLLDNARAVTITGVGGIGKTRLAMALAEAVASRFSDGVHFVDLADAATDTDALWLIEAALTAGDTAGSAARDSIIATLSGRNALLVLDTCDRTSGKVSDLVSRIVQTCRETRVVATSHSPLHIDGEVVWRLGPLALPVDTDSNTRREAASVRLFLDRARAVVPALADDDATIEAIAEICHRVDAIPLAIELAAARVATLPVRDLADRMARRFEVLSRRRGSGPVRHRGLRAALDWSFQSLDERERMTLAALSSFHGSFTLEAVAAVVDGSVQGTAALDALDALVDRSLVAVLSGYPTRYRLLDTIREYAREVLDALPERSAVLRRHAEFYSSFVQASARGVIGLDEDDWRTALEQEMPNLRAVAAWCADAGAVDLAPLFVTGFQMNFLYARHPGRALCQLATAVTRVPGIEQNDRYSSVLAAAALDSLARNGAAEAVNLSASALRHARASDAPQAALPWLVHAWMSWLLGARDDAIELLEEAQQRLAGSPLEADSVVASYGLATYLSAVGARDLALRHADDAVRGATSLGSPSLLASALVLGAVALQETDPTRALARLEKGVALGAAAGGHIAVAIGEWAIQQIDPALAAERDLSPLQQALENAARDRDGGAAAITAQVIALCLADLSPHEAAMLHGAAPVLGHLGMLSDGRAPLEQRLRDRIGATTFETLVAEGEVLGFDGTVALARRALAAATTTRHRNSHANVESRCETAQFLRDGTTWFIEYRGEAVRLRDAKGLLYLAQLVREPFREFHVLDLAGSAALPSAPRQTMFDERALAIYRRAIKDLRSEIDEAEATGDPIRSERAAVELEALVSTLAGAYGVGGRSRPFDDEVERCRKAVWKCIRDALQRVASDAPAIARHLQNSLRTGTYCSYTPESPVAWTVKSD